jgi:hypothetical protein
MNNIFKLKYEGLLKRFLNTTSSKGVILLFIKALFDISLLYQKYVPKNSLLLRKLPSKELKNVIKMECPIDNLDNNKEKQVIIQSSKNLRRLFDYSEKNVNISSKRHVSNAPRNILASSLKKILSI